MVPKFVQMINKLNTNQFGDDRLVITLKIVKKIQDFFSFGLKNMGLHEFPILHLESAESALLVYFP